MLHWRDRLWLRGVCLLENEGQALPLRDGERVAVFGRMAFHYYKSGLGSGGLVNTRYVVGILDALKECEGIHLDEKLMGIYAGLDYGESL